MATYAKIKLSGSTDGKAIDVAATSIGSGTTIHTAQSSLLDFVTLYVNNTDTVPRTLVLGWGGTSDPDIFSTDIPAAAGLMLVVADLPLTNSLVVKASCATGNVLQIYGHVTRVS